jgi:hypothetical protein
MLESLISAAMLSMVSSSKRRANSAAMSKTAAKRAVCLRTFQTLLNVAEKELLDELVGDLRGDGLPVVSSMSMSAMLVRCEGVVGASLRERVLFADHDVR